MPLNVTVVLEGGEPPPPGSTVRVEVRDTSLADAPPEILGTAIAEISGSIDLGGLAPRLAQVTLELDQVPAMAVIWAHVDVDGNGRVSVGDYITTQSFPVPASEGPVTVSVRRI